MIHEKLSGAIIGIAMEVLNELNPGLDEDEAMRSQCKNHFPFSIGPN